MTSKVIFVPKHNPRSRAEWQERLRAMGVAVADSISPSGAGWECRHGLQVITIPVVVVGLKRLTPDHYRGRKALLDMLVLSGAVISVELEAIGRAYAQMSRELGRGYVSR